MLNIKRLATSTIAPLTAALPLLLSAGSAQAHFKLIKPASWIVESASGDPQKAGPCGPEGSSGMMTDEITTVEAGSMLEVEYIETIHHPGWFRISLDQDRSKFEDIEFPSTSNCNYDMTTVPEEPHGNVLADGLAKDENVGGSNRMFKEMIKIPDTPCEKCTLQVIQVMADSFHSPPGCIYYHCADLKIVAAGGGAAGSTGAAGASSSAGAGGTATATGGAGAATVSSAGTAAPAAGGSGGTAGATTGSAAKPSTNTPASGTAGTSTTSGSASAATGTAGKPAATGTTTGATAAAGSSSSGKTETTTAATTAEEPKTEESGCAVATPGAHSGIGTAVMLSIVGILFGARRRQRHA